MVKEAKEKNITTTGDAVNEEILELFKLASKYFFKQYKKTGGSQGKLAKEFGVTQTYLSSVMNGSRSASFELYNQIAEKLYGPLDKFIGAGRRIREGRDPLEADKPDQEDSVEKLIAQLTYYVMDYKRVEKELNETKQFYETIVEKLQSGVLVMDKNHKVIYSNNIIELMADTDKRTILGTTPYITEEIIPGLDLHFFIRQYTIAFESLKATYYSNIPVTTPSGRAIYIGGWMIPLLEENSFNGMICTLRDQTRSHTLHDILTQAIDTCDHGVGIIQQATPSDIPSDYLSNKLFLQIFDLEDLKPTAATVPFPELVEIMKTKMKNGDEWEKFLHDVFEQNLNDTHFIIHLKNGKSYRWRGNPLTDDDNRHLGRMISIEDA